MVILADIGGTKTRVAISADKQTITAKEIFDTPDNPKEGIELIRQVAHKLAGEESIEMAVFGFAGVCSPDRTTIVHSPNLPKWVNDFNISLASQALGAQVYLENDAALDGLGEAVAGAGKDYSIMAYVTIGTGVGGSRIVNKTIDRTHLPILVHSPNLPKWVNDFNISLASQALGAQVYLENDAALDGLGEAVAGAGKDYSIMAYVTIGTGVGGSRIVNKTIDRTHFGFEIGAQIVSFNGTTQPWDELISGKALEKRLGTSSKNVKDEKLWNEVASIFADGLYNTILHWSPECVVLGGSVMKDIPLQIVAQHLVERMHRFPELPRLLRGELGDWCGIYGALALSRILSN